MVLLTLRATLMELYPNAVTNTTVSMATVAILGAQGFRADSIDWPKKTNKLTASFWLCVHRHTRGGHLLHTRYTYVQGAVRMRMAATCE